MSRPQPDRSALALAWRALHAHHRGGRRMSIADRFVLDPDRFRHFSWTLDDLLLDASKTHLTAETLALLVDLAQAARVEALRDAMLAGAAINTTEGRAVLHTALRAGPDAVIPVDGRDVMPQVRERLATTGRFAQAIRDGALAGTGGPFTDVLNIGIGGSDLGPAMVTQALAPCHDGPRVHFVSNVDGAHIADALRGLDPARTLVLIASKTFTTVETMTNAATARAWLADRVGQRALGGHLAAISSAVDRAAAFGIPGDRVFGFEDWVGGRYSVWSAIGLPVMIAIGPARFAQFLAGARDLDRHFATAPLHANLPVLLGLIGVWHASICRWPTRAILPYDQRLARFPAYVQQLDMESNGKGVAADGTALPHPAGPIVWGEPGTNGQHAFHQLLHQGRQVVPVEVILAAQGHEPELAHHHHLLVANALAQTDALMRGRTLAEAAAQLRARGLEAEAVARLAPHRVFPGDRPSVTLIHRRLDPYALGRLIALYEHRVFVEGAIWGLNSFDQWGVELGKELAVALGPAVAGMVPADGLHPGTAGLLSHVHRLVAAP